MTNMKTIFSEVKMYYLHYPVKGPVTLQQGLMKPQVLQGWRDKSVEVRVLFGLFMS